MPENETTITVLVDNYSRKGLATEHGLSLFIRSSAGSILFDTGQSGHVLTANAEALGVDLTRPEILVLSHGHYDHTGGVPEALKADPRAVVYCHPGVEIGRFSRHADGELHDISMPGPARMALERHPRELRHNVNRPCEILPGIHLTGEIPRRSSFEDTGGPFFLDRECLVPDIIRDDMALWIETPGGLVIVLGCGHSGVVNTVERIRELSGVERVRGILGGMHLVHASGERLTETCDKLREWAPEFVIPCHCTGEAVEEFLRLRVGDAVRPGYVGLTLTV